LTKDLIHGLTNQLPEYILDHNAEFGIYLVFNYLSKDRFDKPKLPPNISLPVFIDKHTNEVKYGLADKIRTIVVNFGKKESASKK
jgi:hypothetical protein